MTDTPVLYGFDGSTYVRTVKMLLDESGTEYEQVPVNVLAGETRLPEHLARHPFGKVPVMDIDGMRLRETSAICRHIIATRGPSVLIPDDVKARAKMNEAIGLFDAYGYGALAGVAGHHLFPDLIGGSDETKLAAAHVETEKLMALLMECANPWIVGNSATLADFFVGPMMAYVALTPEADRVLALPGVAAWWEAMQAVPSFQRTAPDLG